MLIWGRGWIPHMPCREGGRRRVNSRGVLLENWRKCGGIGTCSEGLRGRHGETSRLAWKTVQCSRPKWPWRLWIRNLHVAHKGLVDFVEALQHECCVWRPRLGPCGFHLAQWGKYRE